MLLIQMRVPWPCSAICFPPLCKVTMFGFRCVQLQRDLAAIQGGWHCPMQGCGEKDRGRKDHCCCVQIAFLPRRSGWKLLGKKLCTSEPSCGQQKSTSMRAETQTHQVWEQQFQKYMIFCCQWPCSARMKLSAPVCPFIRRSYQICTQTFPSGIKPMATKGVGRVCTANRL